jgi:hypothetical protein
MYRCNVLRACTTSHVLVISRMEFRTLQDLTTLFSTHYTDHPSQHTASAS